MEHYYQVVNSVLQSIWLANDHTPRELMSNNPGSPIAASQPLFSERTTRNQELMQ